MRQKATRPRLERESVSSLLPQQSCHVSARTLTLSHRTTTEGFSLHAFLGKTYGNNGRVLMILRLAVGQRRLWTWYLGLPLEPNSSSSRMYDNVLWVYCLRACSSCRVAFWMHGLPGLIAIGGFQCHWFAAHCAENHTRIGDYLAEKVRPEPRS
jgi:hypothetical protein